MMLKKIILAVILFISLFLLFCEKDKNAVSPGEDLGINGTVTDVNGVPLKNVGVHMIFLEYPFSIFSKFSKISETDNIVLSYFEAIRYSDYIVLHWITTSESGNVGFKLLRSTQQNGSYNLLATYQNDPNLVGHMNTDTTNEYSYNDENITTDTTYWYKLIDVDTSGIETEHGPVHAIEIGVMLPTQYDLFQNYPNPFNPSTTIQFTVPKQSFVQINVLNWQDKEAIATLVNKDLPPGYYTVQWDGKNKDDKFVTNNLYIYTMQADTFSSDKVMCLQMLDPEHIRGLNAVPLVKTNSDGKFLLKYSLIPLGQSFRHTDEVGENLGTISVSQNIKVVLIKDGYKSFVEEMKVDGNSPINKTFRLTPN